MEVTTSKSTRRSTRVRVEIPLVVTSLDRVCPFVEKCVALIVSAQGCAFRTTRIVQIGTPLLLTDLPRGGSVTGRVASCLPLGADGKYFLIGVSLYTHGNVWGVADPPADWSVAHQAATVTIKQPAERRPAAKQKADVQTPEKDNLISTNGVSPNRVSAGWPFNRFSSGVEVHPGRK